MTRDFCPVVAIRALLFVCVSFGVWSPARAECTPAGTPSADSIVCTGTDTTGVASDGGNNDKITRDEAEDHHDCGEHHSVDIFICIDCHN